MHRLPSFSVPVGVTLVFSNAQGKPLQFRITAACGAGFLLFGYDQGVFGGLLDNEPFLQTFGYPDATIQGQIVATYNIGCIIGTLISIFAGDQFGRRRSILIGCCILIAGAVLQTASYSLAQMIVGRVIAGVGNGMNTIAIPIWQAETARVQDRGKLIVAQLVTNIFGIVITNVSTARLRPGVETEADADDAAVDELWVYFHLEFPCQLAVSSCVPMLLCTDHHRTGPCGSRITPLVSDEAPSQRGSGDSRPVDGQADGRPGCS